MANGEWDKIVAQIPKLAKRTFPPDAPDEEISRYRDEINRQFNSGNWLLESLKRNGLAAGGAERRLAERSQSASQLKRYLNALASTKSREEPISVPPLLGSSPGIS